MATRNASSRSASDRARYGDWPFEIGLWVGKAATPNVLGRKGESRPDSARAKLQRFKSNPRGNPATIPLESCPWCGERFEAGAFTLLPNHDEPRELRLVCTNFECEFSGDRPLPVLGVDEPIYRRLPAFLIATVDVDLAARQAGTGGCVLILLDAETDCPRELAPNLLRRAREARGDRDIRVVLAKAEYEAWFLAAADSIAGQHGIRASTEPPDAEAATGAKEWLRARMPPGRSYRETLHQPALTAIFDLDAARSAPSFDKLWRDVSELLGIAGRRG